MSSATPPHSERGHLARNLAVTLLAGALLAAGLWQFGVTAAQGQLADTEQRLSDIEQELVEVEERISAAEAGAEDPIVRAYSDTLTLDQLLPDSAHTTQLEQDLPELLDRHALAVPEISRGSQEDAGDVQFTPYTLQVTGTLAGLQQFAADLDRYPRLIGYDITNITQPDGNVGAATATVRLQVYFTDTPQLAPDQVEHGSPLPTPLFD